MRHPIPNMLLRIAQADAFGCAVEYVKRAEHPDLFESVERFESYHQHPTYHKLKAGCYSDDTQMSVAIAEVLLDLNLNAHPPPSMGGTQNRFALATVEKFSHAFYNSFKRDPRDGYSRKFQAILEEATSPSHMMQLITPTSSANGAAMRSVPIGVIRKPEDVVRFAGIQASVTHATYGGINSAVIVALMSHFALYDRRSFANMLGWGQQWCPAFELFREPWVGPVVSKDGKGLGVGLNTAWAVHTLLTTETSLMGILKKTIKWGGDTDSVASIAWGIASARYPDEVLPEFLERDLEAKGNLKYGPEFLKDLGKRLMETYR